jgi:hypothetical protein
LNIKFLRIVSSSRSIILIKDYVYDAERQIQK